MATSHSGPGKRSSSAPPDVASGPWEPRVRLWIEVPGRGTLGPGKLRLLEAIARTHSLSAAAREEHMSYRLAWEHLRQLEQRTGVSLVEPHRGGPGGGRTELTPEGRALLDAYREFRAEVAAGVQSAFERHFARWLERGRKS